MQIRRYESVTCDVQRLCTIYSLESSSWNQYDAKFQDFKLCEVKFDMFIATFHFDVKKVGGRSTNGTHRNLVRLRFRLNF
jgi:hypothetical protein